jgi:nucleoside-diphosphate-sugar epimerase
VKILITGTGGFLGGYMYKGLLNSSYINVIPHSRQDGDLCNPIHVKEFLERHQPTHIWHFAADPTSKLDDTNFSKAIQNNLLSTQNLLNFTPNGATFLFASSVLVYGETRSNQHVKSTTSPIGVYGAGKLACENLVKIYANTKGFNYTNFRLSAVVGPGMTHGLLKDVIRKCKSDDPELELFGSSPGSSKPFVYAEDVLNCFLKYTLYGNSFSTLNVCGNGIVNVKRIAGMVQKRLGTKKKIKWNPAAVWAGDNRKLLIRQSWSLKSEIVHSSISAIQKAIDENI